LLLPFRRDLLSMPSPSRAREITPRKRDSSALGALASIWRGRFHAGNQLLLRVVSRNAIGGLSGYHARQPSLVGSRESVPGTPWWRYFEAQRSPIDLAEHDVERADDGRVAGQPMLADKATHEGKVAAEAAAGENSFFDATVIPSVTYTDPEVA
jgi:hypothetical protein